MEYIFLTVGYSIFLQSLYTMNTLSLRWFVAFLSVADTIDGRKSFPVCRDLVKASSANQQTDSG